MPNRYSIVASNYIDGAESFIKTLAPGVPAVLVREPDNQYDKNAVAIYVEGRKVGYVPKKQNAVLAQFIDQNGSLLPAPSPSVGIASDSVPRTERSINATFVRSPNSGFPMVEL